MTRLEPMGVTREVTYAKADHYASKAAEEVTENAAEILRQKNPALTVTTIAIDGSPKSVILDEAEAFGADLIVVGSHGYGMIEGFWLGSVSHGAALLHATCSVEVVREQDQEKPENTILLATAVRNELKRLWDVIARDENSNGADPSLVIEPFCRYAPWRVNMNLREGRKMP